MPQTKTTTRSVRGWKTPGRKIGSAPVPVGLPVGLPVRLPIGLPVRLPIGLSVGLAVGLAVALAAGPACGPSADEGAAPGRPGGRGGGPGGGPPGGFRGGDGAGTAVPVEVVEILRSPISAFIETNGTLEAEREVDIVARTGGPLVALNTEEGLQVRAGDLLAQIDQAESRAQVEIAKVALSDAELVYNRAKASLENAVVSQEVYDTAFSALESARAQLAGNEIQLDYTRITAPFDGLIIQRAVKFGETVTAGQQLFRISDFDPLLCTIGVPERDLTRLSIGQPALLEVEAFPGETFQGRVLRISPVVDAATGTIRVTLAVDRRGRLSPGMFAGVRLVTDVREDALIMPKRALSLESLADSVFVVEGGAAYRRNVTLGYEEDDRVEVTSGLEENDRVIVVGQDGLTDATPVQILVGPGAEEPGTRRARSGEAPAGSGMSEERRAAVRERMRERGMTEEQIAARLAAMEGRGGPAGRAARLQGRGPAAAPPGEAAGVAAREPIGAGPPDAAPPDPAPSEAASPPASREAASPVPESPVPDSLTSPAPAASTPAESVAPAPAAAPGARRAGRRGASGSSGSGPPGSAGSGEGSGPGSFEDLPPETREAIRTRLRSMGMTDEQIEERVRRGWGPAATDGTPRDAPPTPEQLEALRERLRGRGMTEEQIEEIVARRRRPQ